MDAVLLPVLDANMTHGIIRAWHKREGEEVHAGEPLFEVETDKINAEVEAESSGIVRRIFAAVGERVPVLQVIAFIGAADEEVPSPESWAKGAESGSATSAMNEQTVAAPELAVAETAEPASTSLGRPLASPAARRLARDRGIDLTQLRGSGLRGEITRADVEAAVAQPDAMPHRREDTANSGILDPTFLSEIRRDAGRFRALSSELKVRLYREHGADVGEHVVLAPGALILAREIHLGDGASVAEDATIECDLFRIGMLAAIGRRSRVKCRSVEIGDALWAKDDVMIGGGGSDEPGATLRAGDGCFFGEASYLNPCHPVALGDEVCVGSRAMLFTHSHWQSVLRGYPSIFGPVEIGQHVFIGNQAFVFPGVSIGDGSTVIVNSFVAQNVPPQTLVGGVPAQVIRKIVAPAIEEQRRIVEERLIPDLVEVLRTRGYSLRVAKASDTTILDAGARGTIQFLPEWRRSSLAAGSRLVALTFGYTAEKALPPGLTVLDLSNSQIRGEQDDLSDEVRECLRRRGIRFKPYAWRYRVGHGAEGRLILRHRS